MKLYLRLDPNEELVAKSKKGRLFTVRAVNIFISIIFSLIVAYGVAYYIVLLKVGQEIRADGGYYGVCGTAGGPKVCWKKI